MDKSFIDNDAKMVEQSHFTTLLVVMSCLTGTYFDDARGYVLGGFVAVFICYLMEIVYFTINKYC